MSDVWVALIGVAGTAVGAIATIIVARIHASRTDSQDSPSGNPKGKMSPFERMRPGIEAIINSSNVPMYFMDKHLILCCCNDSFVELMDIPRSSLIGKHVSDTLKTTIPRCPEPLQDGIRSQQIELIGKLLSDLAPHSDAIVHMDNRNLAGTRYEGLLRLWVHADKVSSSDAASVAVGVFVFIRAEHIDEKTLRAAIKQAEGKGRQTTTEAQQSKNSA